MFKVSITQIALRHLEQYFLWYHAESPKLGEQYLDDFDAAINHLKIYPFAQRIQKNSLRQLKIGRFQCLLIYGITSKNSVTVYRIIHAKMHPSKKTRKSS